MMENALFIAIFLLGLASYTVGVVEVLRGKYRPSVFSRIVWLLLAINGFAGTVGSQASSASIFLAGILLVGCLVMALLSVWKGNREFGKLEWVCLVLLGISAYIWIFYDEPFVNLLISLFGDLIGGIPTFRNVWKNPKSESSLFWFFFFAASVLSLIPSGTAPWTDKIFPLYFTFFDGTFFLLSLRSPRAQKAK